MGAGPALVAIAVVILWGGYGRHWSWTGINGHTATLWDWLHLLLLPIAVAVLPLWLSRRTTIGRRHKAVAAACITAFVVFTFAGYAIPWHWTGFTGNRLWDWLELLALPVAVGLVPLYGELREGWSIRHSVIVGAALGVFTAVVIAGYVVPWHWTGFTGNTLWDWMNLLLLPLLLPTVIVPVLMPVAAAGLTVREEADTA